MAVPCFAGRILIVDLSNEKIDEMPISDAMVEKYLGGRGIAAKLLWDETDKNTDPLGPDNALIISAGALTGTFAPCSGRITVTTKSPATRMYLKTSSGGHWGSRLKYAGYDLLVIKGRAVHPVYLFIDNGIVNIRNADFLWGKNVRQTTEQIRRELGDQHVQVAAIGQGGENTVVFASVMFSTYNAAARGGAGAVMGSKNLKAVAVRGTTGGLKVANPEAFKKAAMKYRDIIMYGGGMPWLAEFGTTSGVIPINAMGGCGPRNFRTGPFERAYDLSGQHLKEAGFIKNKVACDSCVIGCHLYTEFEDGYSGGPEYETLASLGVGLEIDDTVAVLKANELCNLYGLDTISAGGVIQWAVECYEKGLLTEKDTGGLRLDWSDSGVMLELLKKIAFREGIGNLLADGVYQASEILGGDSYQWAVQARGLEMSRCDTRTAKGYALSFALNPRGPDHLHCMPMAEFGTTEEHRQVIKRLTGSADYANPQITEKRGEIVRWHEDCFTVTDALGFCAQATLCLHGLPPEGMAELFSSGTGIDMDENKLLEAGARILTLEQCYNIKLGKTRAWHVLPWRMMNEEPAFKEKGGSRNSEGELAEMLDRYFELRQWDKKTSYPNLKTLESLGLGEIGHALQEMGINLLP